MTRLFLGITGHELAVRDDAGDLVERRALGVQGLVEALDALPERAAVVAVTTSVADAIDLDALAAARGWTTTATNRGSVDWPACLIVDVRGRDAAYAARLAWLWHHEPDRLSVLGERTESYVVVATADLADEIVVEVDPAQRQAVMAAIATLPGVRAVR